MKTEKKPIVTEIYEALGEASMCWNPIPTGVFESSRAAEIGERLVKIVEEYASHPMSAEQYANTIIPNANANDAPYCTTGERWEDIKDAFLAGQKSPAMSAEQYSSGAIHSIGNFPVSAMSAGQVEEIKTVVENLMEQYRYAVDSENKHYGVKPFDWSKETELPSYESAKELLKKLSAAPTVKADGWVSVEEKQRLEQIIELKEKERQEWANMCITKQKRIEELQAGYGDRLPDDYRYEEYGKEILKSISDTFLKNATKADRLSDAEVFQALGETILNFPLPPPPTVNINSVE